MIDLIEWNRSLACEGWTVAQLERLVSRNPPRLVFRDEKGPVPIDDLNMYDQADLKKLPGIDSKRVPELRSIGLTALKAARTYQYEGRRIIALFRGNLKALDLLERRLRAGVFE